MAGPLGAATLAGLGGVAASTPKTVLVIDDDHDIRDLLVLILQTNGYQAAGVSNGKEAISYLRKTSPPSLILLDLMMPIMDAWEFRKAQQSDPKIGQIPVVLLSATDEVGEQVGPLCADSYLRKPIDFGQLLETVGRY
jgi:CheY-like chemotaxis protein